MDVIIERWGAGTPPGFEALRAESVAEGLHFLDRLTQRWRARFYDPASCVLLARAGGMFAAVGAQTQDEYDPHPAHRRIRHFYVAPQSRRQGLGRLLADALIEEALRLAPRLHLRATNERAFAFWDAMGFRRVGHATRTHEKARA